MTDRLREALAEALLDLSRAYDNTECALTSKSEAVNRAEDLLAHPAVQAALSEAAVQAARVLDMLGPLKSDCPYCDPKTLEHVARRIQHDSATPDRSPPSARSGAGIRPGQGTSEGGEQPGAVPPRAALTERGTGGAGGEPGGKHGRPATRRGAHL